MMKSAKILIADDERAITEGLSAILTDEGYGVEVALDGQKALDRLSGDSYGVVLADLKMPKLDGIALLKELQAREITTECIIITGQATVDSAVQAMREGAYDYIEKPLTAEKLNRLKALIPKALDKFNVKQTNRALASQLENLTHFGELSGQSEAMRGVYQIIDAVAPSTASVLIFGESGTGKELVARAIHTKSERAKGPFFALNCAALPKDILENELFGHEKGAFTGSTNEKPGAFEMTDGGTLFLDEVAEMSPDIQVKLLRALESRTVRRLGGKREITVDIRVVAATNKELSKALEDGHLREDLYYRLAVVEIFLPPLRERMGDIKLLSSEFLARFAQENGKKVTRFDDAAMEWILSYHWPGNVRELKNAVERAVILARGTVITLSDVVPRHIRPSADAPTSLTIAPGSTIAEARRQLVLQTFAITGGNQELTAKRLGMTVEDVQAELRSLLSGNGSGEGSPPARAPVAAVKPKATGQSTKGKQRRR
ncbi:MAG TPA: sigma-54 dependent transcriptional regulator [Gemmatimonadaceae bacterium]|nr:sigma-54 dependent transcriptional regulator [Gemmatimonadaceae bacterium]